MTTIMRMIARWIMDVLGKLFNPRRCIAITKFSSGGKSELFSDGERRTYNTGDVVELDISGKVVAYKTHDGLEWKA